MIAEKAAGSIEQAIAYELQNIVKKHGVFYASEHEAYAVLKEEVEEAEECLILLKAKLSTIWQHVRIDYNNPDDVCQAKQSAEELAQEAVQCAAVCERFLETIKKEKEHEKLS